MPKLVAVKPIEGYDAKATAYIKAYMLFPSGILGLLSMVGGVGALGYQLIGTDTYTWQTFLQSSGLLLLGGILGWVQTLYHQKILRERPEVFAARMQQPTAKRGGRAKREPAVYQPSSTTSPWVPVAYLAGVAVLLSTATFSVVYGAVFVVAAYLLPWAGFFWAKLFFWRKVLQP